MIESLKDEDEKICAYIAWQVTDKEGQLKDDGEYIYIEDLWIHPKWRRKSALRMLINLIDQHSFAKSAKWVYWEREKYNHRLSKLISREKITKGDKHVIKKIITTSSPCSGCHASTNCYGDSPSTG